MTISQKDASHDLDFWIGDWLMDSTQPQGDGKPDVVAKAAAKNSIKRVLGEKVIEETFKMPGFSGRSVSVYAVKAGVWRQTWVDDTGAYLTFEGGKKGEEFVLEQVLPAPGMRMRFTKIKEDSFVWIWEEKTTSGYALKWRLDYRRVKSQ